MMNFRVGDIVYCTDEVDPRVGKVVRDDNDDFLEVSFRPGDLLWVVKEAIRYATKEEKKQYLLNQFVDWDNKWK